MATEPLVLAVDDEPGILRLVKLELTAQGCRVVTAENGQQAIKMADEHRPDIVLLDIVMPGANGLEVMRQMRERSNVPVILLTARGSEADKIRGLELGADDYLPKPFSAEELSARVRAVLRRAALGASADKIVRLGEVEVDLGRRTVTRNGADLGLTRTEWMLLQHLAANSGKVMLNSELLSKVWGPEYRGDLQYLRVWVSRLRRKVEENPSEPKYIRTLQGIGYLLDPSGGEAASQGNEEPVLSAV